MEYDPEVFKLINQFSADIDLVAKELNVSPEAIAGAIAEENRVSLKKSF